MSDEFKAVKLTDRVWWVGAIDWNIRDFHGYTTKRGSTYNAYLILADKITLVDTVKAPFMDEMMARIASVIDPAKIDYVISNHSELDHSGSLPKVFAAVKPEKVFASAAGAKTLGEIFHAGPAITPVKDGETLSLGNLTLQFLETRMLHWPDSMFAYLVEEKLLFSQDAFGMHLATSERFADEIDPSILRYEAATYYANILLPYSPLVSKLVDRVEKLGLAFAMIAPDHGPIWRKDVATIIDRYVRWAARRPSKKAVVCYATMWRSTEMMARAIAEGLAASGVSVQFMGMDVHHRSDVAYELLDAAAFIVGSSTLNNNMLPQMADVMSYAKGLRPAHLIGAAFGSYGWSGESVRQLQDILSEMKVELVTDGIRAKHVPDASMLQTCYSLGKLTAEKMQEKMRF